VRLRVNETSSLFSSPYPMTPALIGEERGTAEATYSSESKSNLLKVSSSYSPLLLVQDFSCLQVPFLSTYSYTE
jgi:hypothetical protein